MNQVKEQAIALRNAGYSYSIIQERLKISKSTLSNWLCFIPFKPNNEVIGKIGKAKLKSALYKHNRKLEDIKKMRSMAEKDVGLLSKRDVFMMGIGLYMGEGSKSIEEVRIANADPVIIKTIIIWFKIFLGLEDRNLKITIHAYPDTDIKKSINFWAEKTGLSKDQFSKTVIDYRSGKSKLNKRKLLYGTATLYVKNGGTLSAGVKSLHRRIIGWIESSTKQM